MGQIFVAFSEYLNFTSYVGQIYGGDFSKKFVSFSQNLNFNEKKHINFRMILQKIVWIANLAC